MAVPPGLGRRLTISPASDSRGVGIAACVRHPLNGVYTSSVATAVGVPPLMIPPPTAKVLAPDASVGLEATASSRRAVGMAGPAVHVFVAGSYSSNADVGTAPGPVPPMIAMRPRGLTAAPAPSRGVGIGLLVVHVSVPGS